MVLHQSYLFVNGKLNFFVSWGFDDDKCDQRVGISGAELAPNAEDYRGRDRIREIWRVCLLLLPRAVDFIL